MRPFFTVGHSTRSIAEFTDLLRGAEVTLVVDVRAVRDSLPDTLRHLRVGYEHIASLGGLRGPTLEGFH
jgi:uncharacterized protein (DUF488 family)